MSDRRWSAADRELVVSVLWTRACQGGNAGVAMPRQLAADAPMHYWADAAALLDALSASGRWLRIDPDEPHLIEFRVDGWTIQHPLRCRPDLFACEVNRVGESLSGPPPRGVGVYECDLRDGVLTVGRRREEGASRAE